MVKILNIPLGYNIKHVPENIFLGQTKQIFLRTNGKKKFFGRTENFFFGQTEIFFRGHEKYIWLKY